MEVLKAIYEAQGDMPGKISIDGMDVEIRPGLSVSFSLPPDALVEVFNRSAEIDLEGRWGDVSRKLLQIFIERGIVSAGFSIGVDQDQTWLCSLGDIQEIRDALRHRTHMIKVAGEIGS